MLIVQDCLHSIYNYIKRSIKICISGVKYC
jgi:hypothetical protein